MILRTAFIPFAAMLFLSAGAAAEDGIGRYQAVPIAPAANSAQSGEVLLIDTRDIDTRDGHVWKSRQFCHYFECQMRLAGAGQLSDTLRSITGSTSRSITGITRGWGARSWSSSVIVMVASFTM